MRKTLIIGATSAIAQATAQLLEKEGDAIYLVARNEDKLKIIADDLLARGAPVTGMKAMDALDYTSHLPVISNAAEKLGGLDLAIIAHGTLPDQHACEHSLEMTRRAFETNALSVIALLTHLANYFEDQGSGTIVVLSSAAGDRGRQSNYVYGSAKGSVSLFMQGLRNRLHSHGVTVITIKPGFVDTPMTAGFTKGFLWAQPERIARDINRAISRKTSVCYSPWYWRYIMLIIKSIPEFVFKRLGL
jgi:hypothetical protein